MSKQDVIDYVMNTPHNTNPAILGQKLDEMGMQSDWNQNDPTKADYVKNRTHYTETVNAIYEVDLANDGVDGSNFEWGKPGFLYVETTEEIVQLFKDNWDKVVFTRSDGTVYKAVDVEKRSNPYMVGGVSGDVSFNVNHTPDWCTCVGASFPGVLSVEYPEEVVHKIPEKYLPDGAGGGSGGEFKTLKIIASDFDVTTGKIAFKCNNTIDEVVEWIVAGKLVHAVIDCTPLGEPFPYTSAIVTMPLNTRRVEVALVNPTSIDVCSFGSDFVIFESYKYGAAEREQIDAGTIEWGAT